MKKAMNRWIRVFLGIWMVIALCIPAFGTETDVPESETAQTEVPSANTAEKTGGWVKKGKKTYYVNKKGKKLKGLQEIDGETYYFSKKGVLQTGWQKLDGKQYYFDPKNGGARANDGFLKIGKYTYCFQENGLFRTGWYKETKKNSYYFSQKGRMIVGWKNIGGKKYYFDKKTGVMATGKVTIKKQEYQFTNKGVMITQGFTAKGDYYAADGKKLRKSTIKNLLKVALQPVGSTMYVWGGGWDTKDVGGGISARTIGVSPKWKAFYEKQDENYDYTKTRFQIEDGLDCSGYVGWVIYNTFNTTSGNAGYVMLAQKQAKTFSDYGWGSYTSAQKVKNFKAGDIMSTAQGHVYIVVGSCKDKSVVLLHSSPKGVMISGTATPSGKKNSEALKLAKKYMKKYYPEWYKKYPELGRGTSYLTDYSQMRWYVSGKKRMMSDPDKYRKKTASAVLKDLFKGVK